MSASYEREYQEYLKKNPHIAVMIRDRVRKYGDKTALKDKTTGAWVSTSWKEFGYRIDGTAKALLEMGVKENEMVGIFSPNTASWSVADAAILSIRGVSVPVYATNSVKEAEYIVNDAEIRIMFVFDQRQYDACKEILKSSKYLKTIIAFNNNVKISGNDSMYLDAFIEKGHSTSRDNELSDRLAAAKGDDLATLIYTSGTTGEPKGVMLTHTNLLTMLFATGYPMAIGENDVSFCFLPLSHVFERAWTYFMFDRGAENHYCHDTKQIMDFLKEVKPHYMTSVPRVWEKIYGTITEGLKSAPSAKQKLFGWALNIGSQYYPLYHHRQAIPLGLKLKHAVAKKLVLSKIQDVVGGRCKFFHVGGAPFNPEINRFFYNAGLNMGLGYGMTEIFVVCVCTPEDIGFGTSGKPVPLMKVRVSDEGELQMTSPAQMAGYWKKEEASKAMLTPDGWIKSGDVGEITPEGYIKITDRIKELIITAGGKNISPLLIETSLKDDIYIDQAVAIGDARKYISALIVPSFELLMQYAADKGIKYEDKEDLVRNPEIIKFYEDRINEATKDLGQVEKIKSFTLLPNELTQESGELTPTSKLRRKIINQKYTDIINSMYIEE
ncbi:MAG TPA: long-chain fatty acid--CoA ligase [Spirochaetota bacterium]|nr:long-chain fatty acid--CoA ligase [Spirochaetota bacterium]HPF07753.1 long-chain fatty acid--CoA ligase [Spirochaetota bacterium]HPJ42704.1 long-chain fatty acid--CoA ligase [Spirochaetota bacterium]HPR36923.1 long-chain fatty acid--CoA ligase [Spirochaetota bacterium]HRX49166.1 long-chain fatty acid--CoA ligase [Spirochaetota bacterium]